MNVGVLLAAGLGARFGTDIHKQYAVVNGREAIAYGIDAFRKSEKTDRLIVVLEPDMAADGRIRDKYGVETIAGGVSRAESFQNALNAAGKGSEACEKIIFHEAARPLIKSSVIDHYMDLLDEYDYVETCQHITDSLGSFLPGVPVREDYFLIQAPEAYRYDILRANFDYRSPVYFAAYQLPETAKGYKYFDIGPNYKLTYPEDLDLIEYFLKKRSEQ